MGKNQRTSQGKKVKKMAIGTRMAISSLAALLIATFSVTNASNSDAELRSALAAADTSSKPVVVYVSAPWCAPCRTMKATTLSDSSVIDWLNSKVNFFQTDPTDSTGEFTPLAESLCVSGVPLLVTFGTGGKEIDRHYGALDAKGFVAYLDDVIHDRNTLNDYLGRLEADGPRPAILAQLVAKFKDNCDLANTEKYAKMLLSVDPANLAGYNPITLEILSNAQYTRADFDGYRNSLEMIVRDYPESRQARAAARSLVAYVEELGDKPKAAELLRAFVKKYPDERCRATDAWLFDLTGSTEY